MSFLLRLLLCSVVLAGPGCFFPSAGLQDQSRGSLPAADVSPTADTDANLHQQADAVDDLAWLLPQVVRPASTPSRRSILLAAKQRALATGDTASVARLNAVLAGEAFARAARVVELRMAGRDPATGLLANTRSGPDRAWIYADTGADLFGHLAIGVRFLYPERYPEILAILSAERLRSGAGLPEDISIPDGRARGLTHEERIFAAAEYAKDGLMPPLERLGPDPWLSRMRELADAILGESSVPTPHGPIPADSAEVNGDVLQVLARLAWATGEPRFRVAADRIALAYLDVLRTTKYLPPHRWDFIENEPLERRRFRLSDHGNEILSGLLEWHLGATLRGEPDAAIHREPIRKMLDRLLDKGRNDDGLWYRVLEIPSGRVDGDGLTDNWGYLLQAYLMAAIAEDVAPDGDPARAADYRLAARDALQALPRYRYYDWQQGVMDGYADALESALYLLREIDDAAAADWLDDQIAVLYGFQAPDGRVQDNELDGNFIRTALLYGLAQSQGVRPDPWREYLLVGAARDGACLVVSATAPFDWSGRLVFDTPRHRSNLGLPVDYPRLNEWPEWWTVQPGLRYRVDDSAGQSGGLHDGKALSEGLSLNLAANQDRQFRVCRDV